MNYLLRNKTIHNNELQEILELALIAVYQHVLVIYVLCYYQKVIFFMKTYINGYKNTVIYQKGQL